jgi:DNA primase
MNPLESTTFERSPEVIAGIWARLRGLAETIADAETRARYLAVWRARYERAFPVVANGRPEPLHALVKADEGDYWFPEPENDSEKRLIMIVSRRLAIRRQIAELRADERDVMAMAQAIGFDPKGINQVVRDIEADPAKREDGEAQWALYRRVLGVRGPISEAILPSPVDARLPRQITATTRRRAAAMAIVDGRAGV